MFCFWAISTCYVSVIALQLFVKLKWSKSYIIHWKCNCSLYICTADCTSIDTDGIKFLNFNKLLTKNIVIIFLFYQVNFWTTIRNFLEMRWNATFDINITVLIIGKSFSLYDVFNYYLSQSNNTRRIASLGNKAFRCQFSKWTNLCSLSRFSLEINFFGK